MNQHHFLTTHIWDAPNVNANLMKLILRSTEKCLNHVFVLGQLQNYQGGKSVMQKLWRRPTIWKDKLKKSLERCCELANKKTEQVYKVSSPCLDEHEIKKEELESVGELSQVCSQIVSNYLYLARIGRPDSSL